jgi:hypothetical protein
LPPSKLLAILIFSARLSRNLVCLKSNKLTSFAVFAVVGLFDQQQFWK